MSVRCLLLAALLIAPGAAVAQPGADFDLQAHRGLRGLLPENSIPGFARALEIGVSTLETDVAITRDRVPVLLHDPALNPDTTRGPDGQYLTARGPLVVSLSAAELARYDVGRLKPDTAYARQFGQQVPLDGTRIPRLAELFALVRRSGNDQVQLALETKINPNAPDDTVGPEEFARVLLKAVKVAGLEGRTSIQSFDWRTLQVVQREAPGIPTVYLSIQQRNFDNIAAGVPEGSKWTAGIQFKDRGSVPRMVKAAGGHTWSAYWRDLTPELVREAQGLGLKVLAWTVNDVPTMRQLMDMGVNGIITDRADLLRAEMQARGLRLPPPSPVR
jgi:glycerophosphoryl diester phosphodiesterase